MSNYMATRGFASSQKNRKKFVPSDEQVETATRRILSTVEKYGGVIHATSDGDAINFLVQHVHNRGNELGSRKHGHFRKIIMTAWRKLIELNRLVFDRERYMFVANYRFETRQRPHRQKYQRGHVRVRTT